MIGPSYRAELSMDKALRATGTVTEVQEKMGKEMVFWEVSLEKWTPDIGQGMRTIDTCDGDQS